MLTISDFEKRYSDCSDEELYIMLLEKDNLSEDGQTALKNVIEARGGLQRLKTSMEQLEAFKRERQKIRIHTETLALQGSDESFISKMIVSDILSKEEVNEIITETLKQTHKKKQDERITSKTVFGSLLGGAIGAFIGGIIWGLQMIQMHRIFFILALGIYLLCYGLIKLITRQSRNNTVVLLVSLVSTGVAIGFGYFIYAMFGK